MDNLQKEKLNQYLFLFSLFFIALSLFASFFVLPSTDDFIYSTKVMENGYWSTQWTEYMKWNGRYIATALISLSPLSWGVPELYPIHSLLIIFLFLFSTYYFLREFIDKPIKPSIIFCALFIVHLFNLSDGIYWLPGAWTYVFPLAAINGLLTMITRYFKHKKANYFSSLFLIFLIIGSNETVMVITLALLILATIFLFFKNERFLNKYFVAMSTFAFICFLIVYFAPGNEFRAAYFPKSKDIIRTLTYPIRLIPPYFFMFLNIPFIGLVIYHRRKFILPKAWHRPLLFLTPLIIYLGCLPSYWGMGKAPNYRTRIVIQWLVWLLCMFILPILWDSKPKIRFYFSKLKYIHLVIILITGLLLTRNFISFSTELPLLIKYNKARAAEHKSLQAKDNKNLFIKKLNAKDIPSSFIQKDLQNNLLSAKKYYLGIKDN